MMSTSTENAKRFKNLSGQRVACLKFIEDIMGWAIVEGQPLKQERLRTQIQRSAEENFGHSVKSDVVEMIVISVSIASGGFGETFVFTLAAATLQLMRE